MKKASLKEKQTALETIAREIERCKICKIGKVGKAVPGEGNADADVVFLGEAPGKTEAATGKPFVGRAGKLLRVLIKEAGLKDEDVFITSPVKYLPEYVTPTMEDIQHGKTHLLKQLDVIDPKLVVLMGATAVKAMLYDPNDPKSIQMLQIAKQHGSVIEKDNITYLITYHPAAPLYSPKLREEIKKDFLELKKLINRKK